MFELTHHRNLRNRLHYLKGQLNGIENMMQNNRNNYDVLIQLLAAYKALHNIIYKVYFNYLKSEVALLILQLAEKFSSFPSTLNTLDNIKKNLNSYSICQLSKIINFLHELDASAPANNSPL